MHHLSISAGKIQITEMTQDILKDIGGFIMEKRADNKVEVLSIINAIHPYPQFLITYSSWLSLIPD